MIKLSILEQTYTIKIRNNYKHYQKLGYVLPTHIDKRGQLRVSIGNDLIIDINHLPKGSSYEVTKICDYCGRRVEKIPYTALIKQRKNNNGKDVCIKCSIRHRELLKSKSNSLLNNYPELSIEWVKCLSEGYEKYTPEMVSPKSNQTVLWKCSNVHCGNEWGAKISDRTNGSGCPYCHGRLPSDKNRLSLRNPELVSEWHPTLNVLLPDEVTYSSHKIAWWICSKCKNEWSTPIYSRTITKSGCSVCSESKGEKRIRRWLESQSISFTHQKTFKYLYGVGGFPLSYDFYIPTENMLIEYQGQFHDGSVSYQTKEEYSIQMEHDKRKRLYAKLNNITLLEIWYQDFKNIEFILKEALNDRQ